MKIKMEEKKITIVTYEATTGPAHDLRDYLKNKAKKILFISHPLLFIPSTYKKSSYWELYENGEKCQDGKAFHWNFPELALYFKDFIYSFLWVIKKLKKTDIFFGIGNINALVGIFLKKLGLTKTVIFYCIDYVPQRFQSNLINSMYHRIDKIAVEKSDVTWNLSPRMAEGRKKKWGKKLGNQITVPIGIWYERIVNNKATSNNPHEIIYLGTILEKQGLDMCIEVVRKLKDKIKDIRLTIIGSGPYEEVLNALVKKYNLEKHVEFLGYLSNHEDVERRLSIASLAVALYNPQKDIFSYYADPGKVKSYLACGLPVLITDIPYVARQIDENKCGIIVDYNINDIISKIESFFNDSKKMKLYKANALAFAKKYDWNSIFDKALIELYK